MTRGNLHSPERSSGSLLCSRGHKVLLWCGFQSLDCLFTKEQDYEQELGCSSVEALACNLSMWKARTGRCPQVWGQPDQCNQFKVSLNYPMRRCLQNNNDPNQKQNPMSLPPREAVDNRIKGNNRQKKHKMIKSRQCLLCTKYFIHFISLEFKKRNIILYLSKSLQLILI